MHYTVGMNGAEDATVDGSSACLVELLPGTCWSVIVDKLAARDSLRLRLASKMMCSLLDGMTGLWTQACHNCLFGYTAVAVRPGGNCNRSNRIHTDGPDNGSLRNRLAAAGTAAVSTTRPAPIPHSTTAQHLTDTQALQMLSSMLALAHTTTKLKPQLKPQSYLVPPWLPAQPGNARGFVRVECPAVLNPAFVLTEAQVYWLSWGCLSGHSGGVFVSQCSNSPRSKHSCGFMAAVVIGKQLLAELYLPSGCSAPDRWSSLNAPTQATVPAAVEAAGGPMGSCGSGPLVAASELKDMREVQFELWINRFLVSDDVPDTTAMAARGLSRRAQQNRHGDSRIFCWRDVHALLMECINSNAARARAVAATAVIPPGFNSATAVEKELARLIAAGAPVLDLRRSQYCSINTILAAAWHTSPAAGYASLVSKPACTAATAILRQSQCGNAGPRHDAPTSGLPAMQQVWRNQVAAVQAATKAAVAERCAHGEDLDDDSLADVLAALVKQLHVLAPDVQVLVLPVLLPGGRVGQRLPHGRSGSSRLSAPRLLSLNVPYLVPLRHEWDRLLQLKQVLLMVRPSTPLPSTAASLAAVAGSDRESSGRDSSERQLLHRHEQRTAAHTAGGPQTAPSLLRGVFSHQQLEQEWNQQALEQQQQQLGEGDYLGQRAELQPWAEQAWFEQQLGQQKGTGITSGNSAQIVAGTPQHLGVQGIDSRTRLHTCAADLDLEYGGGSGEASLWGGVAVLPGYALEAIQGMLLSCMDRLAPGGNSP